VAKPKKKAMWKVYAEMSPTNTDNCTVLAENLGEAYEKGADYFHKIYNAGVAHTFDEEDIVKVECLGRED
jgi:hypothetical protein